MPCNSRSAARFRRVQTVTGMCCEFLFQAVGGLAIWFLLDLPSPQQ